MQMYIPTASSRWHTWASKALAIAVFVAASLMTGSNAQAQVSSPSCSFSGSAFNLGTYDPNINNDSTQQIGFTCAVNFAYNAVETSATFRLCLYMGEDAGTQPGYNPWRYLKNNNVTGTGTAYMAYNLFADAAHTQILLPQGQGTPLVQTFTVNRSGSSTYASSTGLITVYARTPAGQSGLPASGYYSYNPPFTLAYSAAGGNAAPSDCAQSSAYTSGQIQVSSQVVNSCTLSTQAVDFGTITEVGNLGTALNAEGQVIVQCGTGTPYTVYLGDGGYSPGGGQRQMAYGSGRLPYQLFRDGAHTQVWNDTNGVSMTATGSDQAIPVYGQLASGTPVPGAGAYSDTVIVTVTY